MTVAVAREFRGRHLLYILAGFFGTMLAVNALFVYFALSTFSGMESDAYEIGLHYNNRIDAGARQAALGWSHSVTPQPEGALLVSIRSKDGAPVSGLALAGDMTRPVDDRLTAPLVFRETSPGNYLATAVASQPGTWIVSLSATRAGEDSEETTYRIKERLWLKSKH